MDSYSTDTCTLVNDDICFHNQVSMRIKLKLRVVSRERRDIAQGWQNLVGQRDDHQEAKESDLKIILNN